MKESIHLILIDVVMPGMSGSKLVKRQAFSYSKMKMLYISGYYTDNAIEICKKFLTSEILRNSVC